MATLPRLVSAFWRCPRGGLAHGLLFASLAMLCPPAVAGAPTAPSDFSVTVRRDGDAIVVDVDLVVRASARETWDVLTDYDHMAQIVSSLSMSRVLESSNTTLLVALGSGFSLE